MLVVFLFTFSASGCPFTLKFICMVLHAQNLIYRWKYSLDQVKMYSILFFLFLVADTMLVFVSSPTYQCFHLQG
jgi:hypothetical protein